MNRWKKEITNQSEWKEKFNQLIEQLRDNEVSYETDFHEISIDLSDTDFNPYTLWRFLEDEMGYSKVEFDKNGWEMDFWIDFEKAYYPPLQISGSGITFELILSGRE